MEIGKKIKQLRQYKGVTQEVLADTLNVSYQAVSKWENGSTSPDIGLLPAISAYFGVTIDDLFALGDDAHLERIENMIENQRYLSEQDEQYAVRYLSDKLTRETDLAKSHGLLATVYNKLARQLKEKAGYHAKLAIANQPDVKQYHVDLVEALNGVSVDWNYSSNSELINFYKSYVSQHPQMRSGYLWLLDHLIADGRLKEADDVLEQLKQVDSGYIGLIYQGKINKAAGRLNEAMENWDEAVAAYPNHWLSYACRADEKARLGCFEEALKDYEKAMSIQKSPRYFDGFESQALVYEILGNLDKAIEMRQSIVTLLKEEWHINFGESIEVHLREIERLKALRLKSNGC